MAARMGDIASCVKAAPSYASSVFVALKRLERCISYYSVGWLLKIMSTSRVIALEAD